MSAEKKIGGVGIEMKLETEDLQKGLIRIQKSMKDMGSAMTPAEKKLAEIELQAKKTANEGLAKLIEQTEKAKGQLSLLEKVKTKIQIFVETKNVIDKIKEAEKKLAEFKKAGDKDGVTRLKIEIEQYKKGLQEAGSSAKKLQKDSVTPFSEIKSKILEIISTTALLVGAWELAKSTLAKSMAFEQAQVSFDVLFGSVEEGRRMLAELTEFAKVTPFTITGVRETALQLKAFGIATENIIPTMNVLGNISRGNTEIFGRLAYAYGQVLAAGKLTGGEMKQFTEAGVPLLDILAKQYGVTTEKVLEMREAGLITAKDVTIALEDMANGKFAGLMEKQSQTAVGAISNIGDAITQEQEKFAKTEAYGVMVQALLWVGKNIKNVVVVFGNAVNAISGGLVFLGLSAMTLGKTLFFAITESLSGVAKYFGYSVSVMGKQLSFILEYAVFYLKETGKAFENFSKIIPIAMRNGMRGIGGIVNDFFVNPIKKGVNSAIEALNMLPKVSIKTIELSQSGAEKQMESYPLFDELYSQKNAPKLDVSLEAPKMDFSKTKESFAEGSKAIQDFTAHWATSFKEFDNTQSQYKAKGIDLTKIGGLGGDSSSDGKKASKAKSEELKELEKQEKEYEKKLDQRRDHYEKKRKEIAEKYKKEIEDTRKEIEKLEEDHGKMRQSVQADLRSLQNDMAELQKSYEKTISDLEKGFSKDVAGGVVELQAELAKLKKDLEEANAEGGWSGYEKQLELQKEIKKIQDEISVGQSLVSQDAIDEATRRAGLGEFAKMKEDLEEQKAEEQAKYEEDLAKMEEKAAIFQAYLDGNILAIQTANEFETQLELEKLALEQEQFNERSSALNSFLEESVQKNQSALERIDRANQSITANLISQWEAVKRARESAQGGGFSEGGQVGETVQQFAGGGRVRGAGSEKSDSIPAMLSDGEFVINAAASRLYAPLLNAINSSDRAVSQSTVRNVSENNISQQYTYNQTFQATQNLNPAQLAQMMKFYEKYQ